MIKKITGVVISDTNYGESSKILNIYTKDFGVIGVISRGCRKLKSNLRSVSSKLIYGEFIIQYKEKSISTLMSADVIKSFKNIMLDISNISYATFILELTSQVIRQNDAPEIYDIFINSLDKIDSGINPLVITNIVQLKYLKYLGVDINIDSCSCCGGTENIVTLNSSKGGYICADCHENEPLVSTKTIKVIRMLYYADINKITKLELSNSTINEIDLFLNEYYDEYTGLYLKSKSFLKKIIEKSTI